VSSVASQHQSAELLAEQPQRVHGLLWWSMVLVSLLLLMLWFQRGWIASDRWPVRWIEITAPEQRVSAEQIRARLRDDLRNGFFSLDLRHMGQQLESISWVASAQIQRSWPDTLVVSIQEHRPVAYWNKQQLISDYGVVFNAEEISLIQELPVLSGPTQRREEVIQQWLLWREMLMPIGMSIASLELSERGSWTLTMSNGAHVALGREQTSARLQRLVDIWPQLTSRNLYAQQIDLRYSNGLAIRMPVVAAQISHAVDTTRRANAVGRQPVVLQPDNDGYSWSVSVQGQARLAVNGLSPLQELQRRHGR
jgi:cell division protein FtsQ